MKTFTKRNHFSFDEMGKYDIPAVIKYILEKQPKHYSNKTFYIGHSMGTTMYWVACHEHEKFMNDSIHYMIAMGPVAFVGNIESPIALVSPFVKEVQVLKS